MQIAARIDVALTALTRTAPSPIYSAAPGRWAEDARHGNARRATLLSNSDCRPLGSISPKLSGDGPSAAAMRARRISPGCTGLIPFLVSISRTSL